MSKSAQVDPGDLPDIPLSENAFLDGRVQLLQPRKGYRAGVDAVFLAAAIPANAGQKVLELGTGTGAVLSCLSARVNGLWVSGLELQPDYGRLAAENLRRNKCRGEILIGDLCDMPPDLREKSFDHVCANPPYYGQGQATRAADAGKGTAHHEETPLNDWVKAGLRRLRPGGTFSIIQRADRLVEILTALEKGSGKITILPIAARTGRPAGRVIVQATKGHRSATRLLAPFILHRGDRHISDTDDYSDAATAILREGGAINLD